MIETYRTMEAGRAALGIPPLPLNAAQTAELIEELHAPTGPDTAALVDLLTHRVAPGVDEAAYVKARFLTMLARDEDTCAAITPSDAVKLLGTMGGGYNVTALVSLLDSASLAGEAAEQLSRTVLVFDAFYDVAERAERDNRHAGSVLRSWAAAEWFTRRPEPPSDMHLTVFRVHGEINTDDLSPAPHAWSRADVPLHALSLLESRRDVDDAVATINQLKGAGRRVAFVGDVVGTGSSRKSAVNSLLWHIGHDIPFVPNKRHGGVVLGAKIAPIFFNTPLSGDGPTHRSRPPSPWLRRSWAGRAAPTASHRAPTANRGSPRSAARTRPAR